MLKRHSKRLQTIALCVLLIVFLLFVWKNVFEESPGQLYSNKLKLLEDNIVHNEDLVYSKRQISDGRTKHEKRRVPVYIVDEHHEVIPYWFNGIKNGLVKRSENMLIHIDGHSDMAPPNDFAYLKEFQYKTNIPDISYFPLMQSNDVFIQSAIFYNLIKNVVWIKPSWYEHHLETDFLQAFVGVTIDNSTKEERFCSCETPYYSMTKNDKNDEYTKCFYLPTENKDREEKPLKTELCHRKSNYRYITLTEDYVLESLVLKKPGNIIVDIDEDYFGVESGVQKFLDFGIKLTTLKSINNVFKAIFNVSTNENENGLNIKIKMLFKALKKIKQPSKREKTLFARKRFLELKGYFSSNQTGVSESLDILVMLLSTLSDEELDGLSKIRYCLDSTPRMLSLQTADFIICHGNLFPNDELNQFYTPTLQDIEKRGHKLTEILTHISKQSIPKIFTICRSLRDGYTPRYLQTFIEKTVLKSIETALKQFKRVPFVIYDDYLLNGEHGWKLD